jgi:hypothetical protein
MMGDTAGAQMPTKELDRLIDLAREAAEHRHSPWEPADCLDWKDPSDKRFVRMGCDFIVEPPTHPLDTGHERMRYIAACDPALLLPLLVELKERRAASELRPALYFAPELTAAADLFEEIAKECADCNYGDGATGKTSGGEPCEGCTPVRVAERRARAASVCAVHGTSDGRAWSELSSAEREDFIYRASGGIGGAPLPQSSQPPPVARWRCVSYCLCKPSNNTGHFVRDDVEGVWVKYDDLSSTATKPGEQA